MAERAERHPSLPARPNATRTLTQRASVHFPSLARRLRALVFRLSPGSSLRRLVIVHSTREAFEAVNRRDWPAILASYDESIDLYPRTLPGEGAILDIAAHYHGHAGWTKFWLTWSEGWEQWEVAPWEIVDMGDRVLVFYTASGRTKGLEFDRDCAVLVTIARGAIVREDNFLDRETALNDPDLAWLSTPG